MVTDNLLLCSLSYHCQLVLVSFSTFTSMVLEEIHAGGGFEFGTETSRYLSLSLNQQQSAVMTKLLPPQTESESMKVETLCVILICSQQQVEVLQQQLIELRDHLSKQTSERQHSATVKAQEQVVLAFWKFFMKEEDQDKFCIWFCSSSRSWRKNWLMQNGKHGKQWVSLVLTPWDLTSTRRLIIITHAQYCSMFILKRNIPSLHSGWGGTFQCIKSH